MWFTMLSRTKEVVEKVVEEFVEVYYNANKKWGEERDFSCPLVNEISIMNFI
jgi:phosphoribosyl-ATP pyrophosphohydrolase